MSAAQKLSKDVQLAVKINAGKLPASALNASQAASDGKTFESAADLVLKQTAPKISICPHQEAP